MAGGGYWLGRAAMADPQRAAWVGALLASLSTWDLLAVPLLAMLVLGVHEIGHLAGGMSQGMRFLLLIVGPFQWHASKSGLRFQWVTHLGLMGGIAAAMPTQIGDGLRRQLLMLIAGGPIASLLLASAAMGVATHAEGRSAAYALSVAALSFLVFLVTAAPLRTAGFMSDGMQLLDIRRGGSAVSERMALLQVTAQSLSGTRPRDWDPSTVRVLESLNSAEPLRQNSAWLLLLYRAMDSGSNAEIKRLSGLLTEHVEAFPDGFRQVIHVELAVCAWLLGGHDTLRRHLAQSRGGVVEKSRRLLAQAIRAQLDGKLDEAEELRRRAIRALPGALDAGLRYLSADQLARLNR